MTPDARKILGRLASHAVAFDLAGTSLDGEALGPALCKIATDGVQACLKGQHDPDGNPWPPLSEGYERWKGRHFPGRPMGVLHERMADPAEVAGVVEVDLSNVAIVTYGISEYARREAVAFQEGDRLAEPAPPAVLGTSDRVDPGRRGPARRQVQGLDAVTELAPSH